MLKELLLVCILTIFTESLVSVEKILISFRYTLNPVYPKEFEYLLTVHLLDTNGNNKYESTFKKTYHNNEVSLNQIREIKFVLSYFMIDNNGRHNQLYENILMPSQVINRARNVVIPFDVSRIGVGYVYGLPIPSIEGSINGIVEKPYKLKLKTFKYSRDDGNNDFLFHFKLKFIGGQDII